MISSKFSNKLLWIAITVLSICQFIRVEPNIVWSSETYIGIFISLMGIAVAVIIGYQAISANEIKNELKEQRRDNENLRDKYLTFQLSVKKQIDNLTESMNKNIVSIQAKTTELDIHTDKILASTQESVAILNALIIENQHGNLEFPFYAFEKMHEALYFGLEYDSKNIEYIMYKLRQYGSLIHTQTFGSGFAINKDGLYYCTSPHTGKSLRSVLDTEYLPPLKEVESKIREHKKFSSLSHDYSMLMKQFYKRIDICASRVYPKEDSEFDEKFS